MKKTYLILATSLALCAIVSTTQARLYKWVDSEGNVHYGDRLPPEQIGKHHEELTNAGI